MNHVIMANLMISLITSSTTDPCITSRHVAPLITCIMTSRGGAWSHKPSVNASLCTAMHVPSVWSRICMLEVSNLLLSVIFRLDFGPVPTVCYFLHNDW